MRLAAVEPRTWQAGTLTSRSCITSALAPILLSGGGMDTLHHPLDRTPPAVEGAAERILHAYEGYLAAFLAITRRAEGRFLRREWRDGQQDGRTATWRAPSTTPSCGGCWGRAAWTAARTSPPSPARRCVATARHSFGTWKRRG
ncbi:MAG TPA: hypothetical protein VE871_11050 [Longimicrobium sp.]|nr:hypothetical protein [Longimicrobium sp.]